LRSFAFNENFTNASGMPPGTPNICRLIRATWSNPPPDVVNSTNFTVWDYVAN